MPFVDQEAMEERARDLDALGLNGIDFVIVTLPSAVPPVARLDVHFHNAHVLAGILASPAPVKAIFPVTGGHRVHAGPGSGEVQVTQVQATPATHVLRLTVEPVGDYSTYTLAVRFPGIDPIFSKIGFKFRPACFSNCGPEWQAAPAPVEDPRIDYLAKDFDSFRHALMTAMQERVPGWEPSSEVDLSQTLLSLFAAAGDELSDYQDRVVSEAYLGSARKRVSLARHARLMDYHVHQGNQADTWLAVELAAGQVLELPARFEAWTGGPELDDTAIPFVSREPRPMHHLLNAMRLYTWSGTRPGLAAGATTADLRAASLAAATTIRDRVRDGLAPYLLVEEHRNPLTGRVPGRDPGKRALLRLLPEAAEADQDPVTGNAFVRVAWRDEDALGEDYCFEVLTGGGAAVDDVSLFHGNLVQVFHGRAREVLFRDPAERLLSGDERHYERTERWGTLCALPDREPLLYRSTEPRSEEAPATTLDVPDDFLPLATLPTDRLTDAPRILVELAAGGREEWEEVISLVNSPPAQDHFAVETDENGAAVIRFGNGVGDRGNGRELPDGAVVRCWFQTGLGLDGNVGADRIQRFDAAAHPAVSAVRNPFDVTSGRAAEPRDEVLRSAPEAYRARQLRAVTLDDYVRRAEELPQVSRAAARYAWTGSWRTVQVAIDPLGGETLSRELRLEIERHLDAVRLIGEDLEIRPPRLVPLEIEVNVCVEPDTWPENVRAVLEQEFSDGYTPTGRLGFFHPDRWTFGQPLRASEILGRLHGVQGVEHAVAVSLKRFDAATAATDEILEVAPNEIIQVHNDRDHMERGTIEFVLQGGRQ